MSLRWIEGFNSFLTMDNVFERYPLASLGSSVLVPGRNNGNALRLTNGNTLVMPNFTAQSTWIVGFAFKPGSGNGPQAILHVRDGTSPQVRLLYDHLTHKLSVDVGNGASVLGTGTTSLAPGFFYFVEFKAVINATTGSITVRVNTTTDISLTGVNTQDTANATANSIMFRSLGTQIIDIDDLHIMDGAGSVNNAFLGDKVVEAIYPSGAGNTTQWTPNVTIPNHMAVRDLNADNTVVSASAATTKDTYAFNDLALITSGVAGVMVCVHSRRTDSTAKTMCNVVRSGGSDTDQSTYSVPSTGFQAGCDVVELNPNGSVAWTTSTVNAAEFGMKVIS
jgi:hypothetical protein